MAAPRVPQAGAAVQRPRPLSPLTPPQAAPSLKILALRCVTTIDRNKNSGATREVPAVSAQPSTTEVDT